MRPDARLNGHSAASNGSTVRSPRARSKQDEEIVRLMIQALADMGYTNAMQALSQESAVKVESALVEDFRTAILEGQWPLAEQKLHQLELSDPSTEPHALFLLREQKLLEQLESRQLSEALISLRTELAPLKYNIERLHFLSSLVMTSSAEDLRARAGWSGAAGSSRADLLRHISAFISPNSMIPAARLKSLLESARQAQVKDCLYHTSSRPISYLIPNHSCPRSAFPLQTVRVLADHNDEVWLVQYSPSGRFLASASADGLIMIYGTSHYEVVLRLNQRTPEEKRRDHKEGRTRGITYMSFSPDDHTLMTCSQNNVISHWDLSTGQIMNQISQAHDEPISSVCWLPKPNSGFVSGGMDKKIHLYGDKGDVLHTWEVGRIYDAQVSHDGKYLVAICTECGVYVFDLSTKERIAMIKLDHELTSLSISKDSKRILLSCSPTMQRSRHGVQPPKSQAMEVQEWSFPNLVHLKTVRGQRQGEFVIKSCYGGHSEQFIMSGSEDSDVYLWHRKSGTLLERISGHTRSVGAVHWSPVADQWASASDDGTVRIWACEDDAPETMIMPAIVPDYTNGSYSQAHQVTASNGANNSNGNGNGNPAIFGLASGNNVLSREL